MLIHRSHSPKLIFFLFDKITRRLRKQVKRILKDQEEILLGISLNDSWCTLSWGDSKQFTILREFKDDNEWISSHGWLVFGSEAVSVSFCTKWSSWKRSPGNWIPSKEYPNLTSHPWWTLLFLSFFLILCADSSGNHTRNKPISTGKTSKTFFNCDPLGAFV